MLFVKYDIFTFFVSSKSDSFSEYRLMTDSPTFFQSSAVSSTIFPDVWGDSVVGFPEPVIAENHPFWLASSFAILLYARISAKSYSAAALAIVRKLNNNLNNIINYIINVYIIYNVISS